MAEDFSKLSGQVDRAVGLIQEAITIIQNQQVDNNNQSTIDALTVRLQGAADSLSGAVPAAPAPAPAPATTSVDPTVSAPVDATAAPSTDTTVSAPTDATAAASDPSATA